MPEVALWQALRHRPDGLKFRRQHPCGPYVLDFYVEQARLAIEIDGEAHGMGDRPLRRDQWLRQQGVDVMRIRAVEVLGDLDAVVRGIIARCRPLHQPAVGPPPLQGGI